MSGVITPNIGIYEPAVGETNYATNFNVGMNYLDAHDHSGPPHGGVQLSAAGIANHSITGIKLNSNCAGSGLTYNSGTNALDVAVDGFSVNVIGGLLSSIKATNAQAIAGSNPDVSVVPSNLPALFASPPPLGSTLPNVATATSYGLPSLDLGTTANATIVKNAVKNIVGDGLVTVAKGQRLAGIGMLTSNLFSNRLHTVCFSIVAVQGAQPASFSILSNQCYLSQEIFTNFVITSDGTSVALQCSVGNRNSGTGNIELTWYADSAYPIDQANNVNLFPASYTASSNVPFAGSQVGDLDGVLQPSIRTTGLTTVEPALRVSKQVYGAPGNGIGVSQQFQYPMASGAVSLAAEIDVSTQLAGSNDQTSQVDFKSNYGGVLYPKISISTIEADARLASTGPNSQVIFNGTIQAPNTGFAYSYTTIQNFNPTSANLGAFLDIYVDPTGGNTDAWIGFDFSSLIVNTFGCRASDKAFIWATGLSPYPTPTTGSPLMTLARSALSFYGTTTPSQAESKSQAALTTTDATPTTIYTITLTANQMVRIFGDIQGTRTDWSASIFGTVNAGARKVGAGAATLIGAPIVNLQTDSGGAPTFTAAVTGNTLIVQVTGVAAQTWDWLITLTYSAVS